MTDDIEHLSMCLFARWIPIVNEPILWKAHTTKNQPIWNTQFEYPYNNLKIEFLIKINLPRWVPAKMEV